MRKIAIATFVLLLGVAWAAAQSYPSSNTGTSSGSSKTTVRGCLSHSDEGYTLTDSSGTTYRLAGDTAQLSHHVGHEVQIKGTVAGESSASSAASSSGSSAQPTLEVSSMKHISETCSTGSKTETEKAPMSEKPPKH